MTGAPFLRRFFLLFLLTLVIISSNVQSQVCSANYANPWQWGSNATWFYGDGVFMNFAGGTGSPTLSYKAIGANELNRGYEGTAAISDNAGNLLAYSNGRSLWKADGTLIANNLLAGNEGGSVGERSSAVQGIVAVRHPFNPNKVFIFTSDDALTAVDVGLNYCILDLTTMTSTVPVRLKDNLGNDYRTTEQVEATFHSNGFDIWIVARQSGKGNTANFYNFYSYSLTCSGLNTTPVKSNIAQANVLEFGHRWDFGNQPLSTDAWNDDYERGSLKISWDGKYAATVNDMNGNEDKDEAIMISDFNNTTGVLSNAKAVANEEGQWSWAHFGASDYSPNYDCEWAPDSKGLYVVASAGAGRLLWLDGSLATKAAIYASVKNVSNSAVVSGDLKLGGDGKLYQATFNNNLNVFTFPTGADLNAGTNVVASTKALTQNSNRGLSNMFIPPSDYLVITPPAAMDCDDAPVNLAATWFCKGTNAEDPLNNPNGWSASCGACITDAANGVFDPSIAGAGAHQIYYSYGALCTVIDTLDITVGACGACKDTSLAVSIPNVCSSNLTFNLNLYKGTAAAGTWTLVSWPVGNLASVTGGNTFNINNTVAGSYTVRYTVAAQGGGCGNNPERTFLVNKPNVTLVLGDDAACVNEAAFALTGGSPGGGTYSGTGIAVSPNFDPAVAGVGPQTITYSYTDGNSCTATATDVITVNALPVVTLTLADDAACVSESAFNLSGGLPAPGTYSGTGVGVSPSFDPGAAGVGPHTITYSHTDVNGCTATATDVLTVNALPVVTLTLGDDAACIDEAAFNLTGGLPAPGTYSGTGVGISPSFDPGVAGVGPHTITYSHTDVNGCTNTATDILTVNDLPNVTLTLADTAACIDEVAFNLTGGLPALGTYSGTGVGVSPSFDPAVAGVGKHAITYTYTDGNGCTDLAIDTLTVNALPIVTFTLGDDAACVDEPAFNLTGGSPTPGTYSGTGVGVSPSFDPGVAGVGPHTITYTHTDANGCVNSNTDVLTVNDLPIVTLVFADTAACIDEAPFALTGGNPTPGTYSGGGITASPTFDPSQANIGANIITYSYTDGNGCSNTATDTLRVNALPVVTLTLTDSIACIDDAAFALSGGSPINGTYSGTGITVSPTFDPFVAGVGPHTITYTFTDANGCVNSASEDLNVYALPVVSLADTSVCPGGSITLIPSPANWSAYLWSTTETTATISYNTPNTQVWVEVTDTHGCTDSAFAQIAMGDTLHVDFQVSPICADASVTLNAAQYGPFSAPVTYNWNTDIGLVGNLSSRTINQQGLYGVVVMDGAGCIGSDSVFVTVNALPHVDLGIDTTVCFTGHETYRVTVADTFASVLWSDFSTDTFAIVKSIGDFMVTVTDANNCIDKDTIHVGEYCKPTILCVPNVTTPNGDGQNDEFKICKDIFGKVTDGNYKDIMDNILEIHFVVYDRWGIRMFESQNVFPVWDVKFNGGIVASGVYYWILTYTDSAHKNYEKTGWVQVIR